MHRRTKALIMLIIALVAVIAFGAGITLCIDWGGASAPPRDYGQPPSAIALPVAPRHSSSDESRLDGRHEAQRGTTPGPASISRIGPVGGVV